MAWNVGKDKVGLLQSLSMPVRFESQVSNEKLATATRFYLQLLAGVSRCNPHPQRQLKRQTIRYRDEPLADRLQRNSKLSVSCSV